MRKLTNRKKTYAILAVCTCILAAVLIFCFQKDSLKLSIEDGETITLEYGIDSIPPVTALYWDSVFDREGSIVPVTSIGDIDETAPGTYTVTYSASFEKHEVSATRTIVIQDTTAPELTLTGGDIGYYSPGYTYTETGFTAMDNYDGDLTDKVITTQNNDSITYTITDSFGNTATATRRLECKDVVPPVITLSGENRLEITHGSTFTDPGASASDDVDGDLTASITVTGHIDTYTYGEQTLTYTVEDSSGNRRELSRHVVVTELTPPELTLSGSDRIFLKLGETYTEPGYSAVDNADGNISAGVVVAGSVDTNTVGAYTVTYTSTDSSNNSVSKTRTIFVYAPQGSAEVDPNGKVVYLSFDDGPGPYTQQLLDILDKYNVKVTFFVTNQFPDYQNMIGEAHRRGHTIAMHTYSHDFDRLYADETAYYNDLNQIKAICESQTGVSPTIIRFPGGTSNTTSKKYCPGIMTALTQSVPANGYQYCDWNVDSMDAGGAQSASTVANNVISGIAKYQNSFVLQHDTKKYSVEAVEEIICWGLANGYTFMPMDANSPMVHHPVNN